MPEVANAEPSNLSKESVYALAESFATQLGYQPGGDLMTVVANLGGRVTYKDFWVLDESDSGSLMVQEEGDFEIYVAKNTSLERDRFTIAHELGHYVLHYLWRKRLNQELDKMCANRYGSDRAEWEANWFAAAFLMPRAQFVETFRELNGDIVAIGKQFGVSSLASKTRAKALGLVEADEYSE